MKTVNLVVSKTFRILLIFLLVFIWIRFYQNNLLLSVLYSAILAIICDLCLEFLLRKKQTKDLLKKEEILDAKNYAYHFLLNDKSVSLAFFEKILNKHFAIHKKSNYLWWDSENEVTVFYPCFNTDVVKIRDVISIYNSIKGIPSPTKIIICATIFDQSTVTFAKSSPINFLLFDQFDTYEKLMKPNNLFPSNTQKLEEKKQSNWQNIAEYAFNRKRTKTWLFSGLLLIFSSLFVRVSIYYLIISSILIIFAIISFTNTKYNSKPTEKLF